MPIGADGRWYDDGTDDPEDYGLLPDGTDPNELATYNNMFLGGGGAGLPYISGDVNQKTGQAMPFNVQTLGRQGNALQDQLQLIFNPQAGILGSLLLGQSGVDYNQLLGGAGGGGGSGATAEPPATPLLDMYANSSDDIERAIYDGLATGTKTPNQMKMTIRTQFADDPDTADAYMSAVDDAWKEASQLLSFQQAPAKPSELEQVFLDAGLPSPLEQYTPDTLPQDLAPDLANNQFLQRNAASAMSQEALMRQLQRDAEYRPAGPQPTTTTVGAPAPAPDTSTFGADRTGLPQMGPLGDVTPDFLDPIFNFGAPQAQGAKQTGMPKASVAAMKRLTQDPAEWTGRFTNVQQPADTFQASGPVRTIKTKRGPSAVQTNMAGQRVYALARSIAQKKQQEYDRRKGIGEASAILAAEQGRSPTSDAVAARIQVLRQMGIGI